MSGVTKLIKPVYPDAARRLRPQRHAVRGLRPEEPARWKVDGGSKSLPLYPRLHLLPNGSVYFDAAGQTFNPSGQAYDEATWNTAASYDPRTSTWRDLGLPAFGPALVGFRGSSFSQMLPLRPNAKGEYDTAQFLSAGGVYGVSPGTYVATDTSTLNTVTIGAGGRRELPHRGHRPAHHAALVLDGVSRCPTGQVIAFSGADRDEVVNPGSGTPVTTPEIYDPVTKTWSPLAGAARGRTYHNTATLLPDGRVLVGGHAPIATGYASNQELPSDALGLSEPARDPSFELFSPPNLFYGPRPVISSVPTSLMRGRELTIRTPDARGVSSVAVARNTALTHLVDGDQRTVLLPVVRRTADSVTVKVTSATPPSCRTVRTTSSSTRAYAKGETPSVGRQVFVGAVPARFRDDIAANTRTATRQELAARDAASTRRASRRSSPASSVSPAPLSVAAAVAAAVPDRGRAAAGRAVVGRAAGGEQVVALAVRPVSQTSTPVPRSALLGLAALGVVGTSVVVRRVLAAGRTAPGTS